MDNTPDILRKLRKQRGVTQGELAKMLGFTSATAYQNYERGINEPSNRSLCLLADYYGVTTDYLLGREEKKPQFMELDLKPLDNDEFIRIYSGLPEQVKEIFVDTMAKLAQAQQPPGQRHSVRTGDLIDEEQAEKTGST